MKLKIKQRLMPIREQKRYETDTPMHYMRYCGVSLKLEPSGINLRYHKGQIVTLSIKDISVSDQTILPDDGILTEAERATWLPHVMGKLCHKLNHLYYEKHCEDPETYPLNMRHNHD